ncbi:MAG: FkbM family methyltransferase [Verrucomicrobiales bacterium]|nr:FkbM family methyltransferase [Verrucomicrobiales bacterium]
MRPWVNRYRKLRQGTPTQVEEVGSQKTNYSGDELANGLNREKKARLDEGELIRSYFSTTSRKGDSGIPLCIDVGAHYGSSARPLLEEGWRVVAFEPDEKNREKLNGSLKSYIPEKLVIEELAVSDEEADNVSFFRSEVSTGISGLSSFHESHTSAGSVSTTTLATYAAQHSIGAVDFLKIDTEGFDFHVLRGVPWSDWKPGVILCEFEDRKTLPLGYGWKEMAEFLIGKGYEIWVSEWHPITEYGKAHDWNRMFQFPGELSDSDAWGNLLAFQDSVDPKTMESLLNTHLNLFGE